MIGKEYFVRQATTLLKFAKTTKDPNVSAGLLQKATVSDPKLIRRGRMMSKLALMPPRIDPTHVAAGFFIRPLPRHSAHFGG
jgi:hypothetical protein